MASSSKNTRSKRTRTTDEAPIIEYDRNLFTSPERFIRYQNMKNWTFVGERFVEDCYGYIDFNNQLFRRGWLGVASPQPRYDTKLVKEFYANAYPIQGDGEQLKKVKVRGKWVRYDRDTLNQFFEIQWDDEWECAYEASRGIELSDETVANMVEAICQPGKSFEPNQAGKPGKFLRSKMNTMAQIWMSFLISNMMPTMHSSDLPMDQSKLLYYLLPGPGMSRIDVAQIISNDIYQFATQEVPKVHGKTLGFPSLITSLCLASGINNINYDKSIRQPINPRFIQKYCEVENQRRRIEAAPVGEEDQQNIPPPPQPQPNPQDMMAFMQTNFQNLAIQNEHIALQNAANHRGMVHLHLGLYNNYNNPQGAINPWMSPQDFGAYVAWPGDNFGGMRGGVGPSGDGGTEAGVGSSMPAFEINEEDIEQDYRTGMDDLFEGRGN